MPAGAETGWVAVGRLLRTRGNRGEMLAEIYSSQPGRAERLEQVRLEKNGASRMARVERVWHHQGRPVLKFEGLDSISGAEIWAGADILVEEAARARPSEGEYSLADLIGCEVVEQPSGRVAGVVKDIEEPGGPPLLVVQEDGGREVLVPFARAICREIDVEHKRIRAWLPEGLTEL